MHRLTRLVIAAAFFSCLTVQAQPDRTWAQLQQHPIPTWFQDAKFGIYTHWGVYAVPAYGSEWYPRLMYQEGSDVYRHHLATYGDPSIFGYKDFIPRFTAEHFDPDAWADLFQRAGARFAGPVAEHHDGFSMWASRVNRWNAGAMGPKRDVVGELTAAIRRRGMKVITSFHHAFNLQGYYTARPGWDTADPRYHDLYGQWPDAAAAYDFWWAKLEEVIDAYQPDQIWFDFGLGRVPDEYKRRMASTYYGHEAAWGKEVIITRKGDQLPDGVGVLDIERGKMDTVAPRLWQTDDSVATNSWGYVEGLHLKPAEELVHELVDIVSKNGVLLLNIGPKADGTIPDDQQRLLLDIGDWLTVNGEAIYGTRPWVIQGEGANLFDRGRGLGGSAQGQVRFTSRDLRFTTKPDAFYVLALGWPAGTLSPEYLQIKSHRPDAAVTLLGQEGKLPFEVVDGRLKVSVPNLPETERPCAHAYAFRLAGFDLGPSDAVAYVSPGAVTLAADRAVFDGNQVHTETRNGRVNIGFWDKPTESVHWLLRVQAAGEYQVRAEVAAAGGPVGIAFEVDGRRLEFEAPKARDWDDARFVAAGRLTFDQPGIYHAVLRPADPAAWRAVNVWQVQLAPAAPPGP